MRPVPAIAPRPARVAALLAAVLPLLAAATPPIDQPGTLAYSCAGAPSANGMPVTNIELSSLFLPGDSKCREAFSQAFVKVKAKATHAVAGSSGGVAQALPGGKLRVRTSSSAEAGGETGGAIAGFTDVLLIDAPGLTGTSGILHYRMKVKGRLHVQGLSGITLLRILPLAPHLTTTWKTWSAQTDWSLPEVTIDLDEIAVVSTNFVFGLPLNLTTVAWAHSGGFTANGSVAFDAPDALRLKGVDHVTTYEGLPVTGYTLQSQAGLPW